MTLPVLSNARWRAGSRRKSSTAWPIEGRIRHYEARIVRCDDESMLSIVREVTERKEAEGALQHAREDLVRLSRVTAMGELTASIAHEVNQPLSAIVANARACPQLARVGEVLPGRRRRSACGPARRHE